MPFPATSGLRAFALALCSLCGLAAGAAHAGSGVLKGEVVALQDPVSYARPGLQTWLGYRVTVSNDGGNTVNDIHYRATLQGPWQGSGATFDSAEGVACTATSADLRSIDCSVGQLKAGESAPSFVVFFKAPDSGSSSAPPCGGGACAALSSALRYAEGTGGPTSPPQNSNLDLGTLTVGLGTSLPTVVRSAVPKAGGTLFTGNDAVARSGDLFTASVVVPAGPSYTTGAIVEQPFAGCSNFLSCVGAELQVPGLFSPYLTITLRQDAANIRKGTKIGSVLIQYTPTDENGRPLADPIVLGACPAKDLPLSDRPCINGSRVYDRKNSPTPDYLDDFEWTVIGRHNGSFKVF